MKARAMGLAGLSERAFERAGKLENRRFGRRAIGLDRLLSLGLATRAWRADSGGSHPVVASTPARPNPRAPVARFLGRRSGRDLQLIAVVGPALSGESFHPQKVGSRFGESVDKMSVGGLSEDPYRLIVVCDALQALRIEPASLGLIDR